jgi:hypothetical protein
VVNGLPSVNALSVTPGSGATATSFTLTATVSSGAPSSTIVPTGEVVFYTSAHTGIPGNEIGYAPVINGVATLPSTGFLGGTNYIVGIYFGDTLYASSTSNYVTLTVSAAPSTLTLTSSANPVVELSPLTFSTQLSSADTAGLASQPITLTITSTGSTAPIVAQLTTGASGQASYTTSTLTAGAYTVTASYNGSASLLSSAAGPLLETLTPKPSTVTTAAVTPEPSTYGQPTTFTTHVAGANGATGTVPTGLVEFDYCNGATYRVTLDANGNASYTAPLSNGISEPTGSCPFAAHYLGDTNFPASTSATVPWIVLPSNSMTTLTASTTAAYVTQPVTLTATVAGTPAPVLGPGGQILPPGATTATGTVQFFANGAPLGTPIAVAGNSATLTVTTLPQGTDTVTAVYTGDANLNGSASNPIIAIVTLPDFTVTAPTAAVTVATLHRTSTTLSLTSLRGFNGPVTLTCTEPYPAFLTCSQPTVMLPLNGTATATMTLDTSGVPNFYGSLHAPKAPRRDTLERLTLALLLPLPLAAFSRRRRRLPTLLLVAAMSFAASSLTACGTHLPDSVAPGTYSILVTATGQSSQVSAPISHTATITLTVTQ